VVGGGIAGLSAAWELRDRDVLVLEAEERAGGRLMSEPRGRYWLNFGGHVLAGEDSATGRLLAATGVDAAPVPGVLTALAMNGRVLAGGRVETYPLRLQLTRHERLALLRAGARVRLAVLEYGRVSRRRAGESEADRRARVLAYRDDRTFADFLGEVPAEVDAIFRPTIQRSSGEPEQVSAGYGIGYFQLVWDRKGGLTRNVLGGSARLPGAIADALGGRVRTGARVERVVADGDGVTVALGGGEQIRARFAVVATAAYAAREILEGIPAETADALGRVAYGPYVVGALLTDEPGPMPYDGIYAVATPKTSFNMLFTHGLLGGGARRRAGRSRRRGDRADLRRRRRPHLSGGRGPRPRGADSPLAARAAASPARPPSAPAGARAAARERVPGRRLPGHDLRRDRRHDRNGCRTRDPPGRA